jgi:hypothetical protein
MGLDANGVKFLLYAKSLGVNFSETATIGRQYLYIEPSELQEILSNFNCQVDDRSLDLIFKENSGYAETLFRHIGADKLHSFDCSSYENATYLHDMNCLIPEFHKDKYDVVIDGGALEHIFNFPVAIKNCMEMVKVGGHYLGMTIGNNFMGHGFYQFSPELLFRIFTPENGYEIVNLLAMETAADSQWFSVRDPNQLKERVTLVNQSPLYIFVIAKKLAAVEIFKNVPQQSDYATIWQEESLKTAISVEVPVPQDRENKLDEIVERQSIAPSTQIASEPLVATDQPVFDPKFFVKINPEDRFH